MYIVHEVILQLTNSQKRCIDVEDIVGGKNNGTNLELVDSIFMIIFLKKRIYLDVLYSIL